MTSLAVDRLISGERGFNIILDDDRDPRDMQTKIIGIDCATHPSRVGVALGLVNQQTAKLLQVEVGGRDSSIVKIIVNWINESKLVLLALDAPLGWPASLGEALVSHTAGQPIAAKPDELFRRVTDHIVKEKIGKQTLDVGADRIARTAYAALILLQELREITGHMIPLAWHSRLEHSVAAIEVYPAGTLRAYGLPASGYKKEDRRHVRHAIISGIRRHIQLPDDLSILYDNSDVLDAAICVLAATDFLSGNVISPTNQKTAQKEGWIWVRRPQ